MTDFWKTLGPRERFLFAVTAGVIALVVVITVANRLTSNLGRLDTRIAQLQTQLVSLHEQEARSEGIRQAFAEVQEQHSSAWTGEEIHDRLRREIDRLSLRTPYAEGGSGAGVAAREQDYLIYVPRMAQGVLTEEEDYRQYRITLRANPASLDAIVTFLTRLHQSNQSLWIERLELLRSPQGTLIASTIDVTRAVLAGVAHDDASVSEEPLLGRLRNASFEYWRLDEKRFPAWEGDGIAMNATNLWATHERRALEATAARPAARVFQAVDLAAGREFEISVDIASENSGRLTVALANADADPAAGQELIPDGKMYRYRLRFRVPGPEGEIVRMHVPMIILENRGSVAYVDNATLRSIDP